MKQLLAAAAILALLSAPASATEWVSCGGAKGKVSFDVLLGLMDVIAIDTVNIEANGKKWSNKPGAGAIKVEIGQAFETADQMWIDVLSEGMGGFVAKLRLFKASEVVEGMDDGAFDATGGVLHMPGVGAWTVSCSGP
jgi:opacity protein-like surface antigen